MGHDGRRLIIYNQSIKQLPLSWWLFIRDLLPVILNISIYCAYYWPCTTTVTSTGLLCLIHVISLNARCNLYFIKCILQMNLLEHSVLVIWCRVFQSYLHAAVMSLLSLIAPQCISFCSHIIYVYFCVDSYLLHLYRSSFDDYFLTFFNRFPRSVFSFLNSSVRVCIYSTDVCIIFFNNFP